MEKTKNYKMFKFIEGNREIDKYHVEFLMEEIKANNLLFAKPIDVDKDFGVIDGQHRLLAAMNLSVDIYFEKHDNLQKKDMITLNRAQKNWTSKDYLNYFVNEKYEEYIKLKNFMNENKMSCSMAIGLCDQWRSIKANKRFREGEFVFNEIFNHELIDKAKAIIQMIKTKIGNRGYLGSNLFLKSICVVLATNAVDHKILVDKIDMQLPKLGPQTNIKLYIEMLLDIYNFRSKSKKVSLEEMEI